MERPCGHQPRRLLHRSQQPQLAASVTTFLQSASRPRGLDLDVNTDLGGETHLIFNYGFARPRFDDAEELTGKTPRFVPGTT